MARSPLYGSSVATLASRKITPSTAAFDKINDLANKAQNRAAVLGIKRDTQAESQQVQRGQVGEDRRPVSTVANEVLDNKYRNINEFGKRVTNYTKEAVRVKNERERAAQATSLGGNNGGQQVQSLGGNYDLSSIKSEARAQLVSQAMGMIGTPYAWGGGNYGVRSSRGTGKGTQNVIGVDCSGLVTYVYSTLGVRLPARQSDAMLRAAGYRTSIQNLQPGDLVGWGRGGHVALYIGNGEIIESPNVGKTVRRRRLGAGENVFGVHIRLSGE